jgi:hypothetical protein
MSNDTTQGKFSSNQNHTVNQKISKPQDFIAVAGSAEGGWSNNFRSGFQQSEANRYMFINQAIRALYTFDKPVFNSDGTPKKQRILVVFQFKYTVKDIERINLYAEQAEARVIYVKNEKEFIDFLNKRKSNHREIKRLEIYSHGVVGSISFHYSSELFKHERVSEGEFNKSSVDKVSPEIFAANATVASYACRTGIGKEGEAFENSSSAKPEHSLAQYMANKWGIPIQAFERRSLYEKTYGSKTEYDAAKGYTGEDPLLSERAESITQREINDKDGGPIMPKGAWHPPTSGKTPEGLKNGLQTYQPQK